MDFSIFDAIAIGVIGVGVLGVVRHHHWLARFFFAVSAVMLYYKLAEQVMKLDGLSFDRLAWIALAGAAIAVAFALSWHWSSIGLRTEGRVVPTALLEAAVVDPSTAYRPGVESLRNLSNDEIRRRVGNLASKMRTFQAGTSEGYQKIFNKYPRPKGVDSMDYENTEDGRKMSTEYMDLHNKVLAEYNSSYAPEAFALRDEIMRRRGYFPPYPVDFRNIGSIAFRTPVSLAGPSPISDAAAYLEELARSLP